MSAYRIGIVGTGTMGRRMMALMDAHPHFSVQAICDPSGDMLDKARELAPHAARYQTCEEMVTSHLLQCVYIASPPASHPGYLQTCFNHRLPVYCEKPLAISMSEAASVVARARREKQEVVVNFPFASTPSLAFIQHALSSDGTIGKIQAIEIYARFKTWPRPWQAEAKWLAGREEGGFTREVLSHFLFATRRIVAADLTLESKSTTYSADPALCETHLEAMFTANQIPITVSMGVGGDRDDENRLTVTGTNGALRMRDWYEGDVFLNGTFRPMELGPDPRDATMRKQLDNVSAFLGKKPHSLATIEEAFQVQQHIESLLTE